MIYFDNSATTKPYPEVIDSFIKVSTEYFGNPSSLHGLGAKAESLLTQARRQVADLLQVKSVEIYFTSGGTEGNNLAVKGIAHAYSKRGKHIITTVMEHASIKDTCQSLEEEGFDITYLQVDSNGLVSVEDLKNALRTDTILVSVMSVNNEVGWNPADRRDWSLIKRISTSDLSCRSCARYWEGSIRYSYCWD